MKIKNKGKVYPSPSSSSSSSDGNVLKLLPAAILALASVLSIEDREVLAYMISRSMDTSIIQATKKRPSKKPLLHKPPIFDCDCFDCYTSYWFRWDSSPNRELIHQVIDAYEDHLTNGQNAKRNGGKGKKKERMTRPLAHLTPQNKSALQENPAQDMDDSANCGVAESQDNEASPPISPAQADGTEGDEQSETEEANSEFCTSAASNHRGLARKVLPDVLGLLNSRLWNLWSPNV